MTIWTAKIHRYEVQGDVLQEWIKKPNKALHWNFTERSGVKFQCSFGVSFSLASFN